MTLGKFFFVVVANFTFSPCHKSDSLRCRFASKFAACIKDKEDIAPSVFEAVAAVDTSQFIQKVTLVPSPATNVDVNVGWWNVTAGRNADALVQEARYLFITIENRTRWNLSFLRELHLEGAAWQPTPQNVRACSKLTWAAYSGGIFSESGALNVLKGVSGMSIFELRHDQVQEPPVAIAVGWSRPYVAPAARFGFSRGRKCIAGVCDISSVNRNDQIKEYFGACNPLGPLLPCP
eukprot:SAG11_NODE_29_length_23137_cov_16.739995_10_plen_235_part_00